MISIITPVLNGEKFIEKNINSVSSLSIPYEHIIVDGGSTDDTLKIVSKYPHLRLIHQKSKKGMYHAIDQGFVSSKGNVITWINADDWLHPVAYEKMYHLMNSGGLDLVYGASEYFFLKENRMQFHSAKPFGKFLLRNRVFPFIQPSSIYKRDLYFSVGGMDYEKFKIIGDIDLFHRMACVKGIKVDRVQGKCTTFLKYGDSLGDRNHDKYLSEKKFLSNPYYGKLGEWISKVIFKLF